MIFEATYRVSFGDCDPAGIVFYPNLFAWLDRTFHRLLDEKAGGHAAVCKALGAKGIGLTHADCSFKSPVTESVDLTVALTDITWDARTFTLAYTGRIGDRTAFEGAETRAVFTEKDGRMGLGDVAPLRAALNI
ncbi:MAG: acyl-CoA thioesterase [Pseudomonadota bacterium]